MTTAYSPTAQVSTTDPAVHADGDSGNATNFNRPVEPLLDARAFVRSFMPGAITWAQKARVATGGASSGNTGVYVPAIASIALFDGTAIKNFTLAAETQLTTATHFGGGTLVADTTYYVYACVSASALTFLISPTAPEASLTWRSGATTHRYLFCFHTSSASVALPMQMSGGHYTYRFSAITSTELRALNATAVAGSPTDIILARAGTAGRELLPPHARIAHLRADIIISGNSTSDQVVANFYTNGDTTSAAQRLDVYAQISSQVASHRFSIECDSSATIDYTLAVGNTDGGDPTFGSLMLYVTGFEE